MKKSRTLLAFLALALAVATVLPGTWAYFTANTSAGGGRTMHFQNETDIEESFSFADWNKQITITAEPGTQPVWVRARAYSAYGLDYTTEDTGWYLNDADDWYYFNKALANPVDAEGNAVAAPDWTATQTDALLVHVGVANVETGKVPEGFDVPVVYETTPVTYNEDGSYKLPTDASVWSTELIIQNGGAAE